MRLTNLWMPAILATACGPNTDPLPLPPLQLVPRTQGLQAIRDAAPQPPDPERRLILRDLMETAFVPVPGMASQRVAMQASRSLLEDEDAFWVLEEGLDHENPHLRAQVAYHLGQIASQPSLFPLLRRLKYEQDPSALTWVADALARLHNHAGLPHLIEFMDSAETANEAGLVAMDILRSVDRDPGTEPTYAHLRQALGELYGEWQDTGQSGTLEPEPLTRSRLAGHLLNLMGFQLRPVDDARFILARSGTLALPFFRLAITAEEDYLRVHALEVVTQLGRAARPLANDLLPLLGDPLSATAAIQALGAVGAVDALPHLLQILDGSELELRIAVAGALGPLGAAEAVPFLQPLLGDETETMDLRVNAAFSLALLDEGGEGRAFLEKCQAEGLYHAATVTELLESLREAGR